jgi:hypothetical protein
MLLLINGLLFLDKSSYKLPLRYMFLIKDISACDEPNSGSAILAYLYRFLCDAADGCQNEIMRSQTPHIDILYQHNISILNSSLIECHNCICIFLDYLFISIHLFFNSGIGSKFLCYELNLHKLRFM